MRSPSGRLAKGVLAAVAVVALTSGYVYWDNQQIAVRTLTVSHPDLPAGFEGYRILQITDLEGRRFGDRQQQLVEVIERQEFDMVLLTGDFVRQAEDFSDESLAPLVELLERLPGDVAKFYVLGSGEIPWAHGGSYAMVPSGRLRIMDVLEQHGFQHIYPAAELTRGTDSIWLTGLELSVLPGTDRPTEILDSSYVPLYPELEPEQIRAFWQSAAADGRASIETAAYRSDFELRAQDFLERGDKDGFHILVSHRPADFGYVGPPELSFDELLQRRAEDPTLRLVDWEINISGHTHGGLWRIPLIGPLIHPNIGLMPPDAVTYGLNPDKDGHRNVWISSGLAAKQDWYASFRLFNPPEIAVLTLSAMP